MWYAPERFHALRHRPVVARQHEPQLRQQLQRAEERLVVLVWPAVGRIEHERLARDVAGREPLEVDPEVDRPHALRRERQPLDQRLACVLGYRDHDLRPPRARAVQVLPVRELPAREVLGQELVLQVQDRRRGCGRRDERDHHAQREVDPRERLDLQLAAKRPAPQQPARHRPHAPAHVRGGRVPPDDPRRQPVGRILRDRGQEDPVLVLPDASERPAQLARVRLRPADDPGHEREERDSDHEAHPAAYSAVTTPLYTFPRCPLLPRSRSTCRRFWSGCEKRFGGAATVPT